MEHTEDQFLTAGGIAIFTQTWRPPDPRAVVVVSHGFAEHSGRYAHVAEALCDAGFAVAAFDHRGHGRSGGSRALVTDMGLLGTDLALFREQVARALPDLPQVLLGHSMGCAAVIDHLSGHHREVAAVVLSGPFLRNASDVPAPLRALAPWLGRLLPGVPTQKLPASDVSRDPAVVRAYEEDPLVFHGGIPAGTGATLLALERTHLPRAERISEPTLIVHGTADRLAAVSGAEDLAAGLGSQVVDLRTYDGLYHEVFNEPERDRVIADVIAWLDERVADRSTAS
ncbi:lysophospholipase [Euzebya sp.]|uniref:alpha/beta hydrolase n=1 Tax=Euzebya sp. TaxID=1971409 RepID=UPI00351644E6